MKKARKATKSLFKALSGRGSGPLPATTPQASTGSDVGGSAVISAASEASGFDDEASSDQTASINVMETTQSRAASGSSAIPQNPSFQREGAEPEIIDSVRVTYLQAASPSAFVDTGEYATSKFEDPIVHQQFVPVTPIDPAPTTPVPTGTQISRSASELDSALETFKKNYDLFAIKNPKFLLVGDEFQTAFASAKANNDIKRSAQIFGDGVWSTLQTIESKHIAANTK